MADEPLFLAKLSPACIAEKGGTLVWPITREGQANALLDAWNNQRGDGCFRLSRAVGRMHG